MSTWTKETRSPRWEYDEEENYDSDFCYDTTSTPWDKESDIQASWTKVADMEFPSVSNLLLEGDGSNVLLESGEDLLLEQSGVAGGWSKESDQVSSWDKVANESSSWDKILDT